MRRTQRASRGVSVGAVTRLAREDQESTALLRRAGANVIVHESPHSTLMRLEYPTDNVDERILTVAAVADPFLPEHVEGVRADAILVSPSIRGEVPLAVVTALRAQARLIGLDVQGFVRIVTPEGRLKYERCREMSQVLALVDVLKSDAVEAEFLTGETDIRAAAKALAAYGPREIVLTHKDGVLVLANGEGFAHLTFERDRMTVRIIETPEDGSGTTQVAYEHAFARRQHRGAP